MKTIFISLSIMLLLLSTQARGHGSAPDEKTITISSDSLEQQVVLQGQQVIVDGNYNKIQLSGTASKLVITGNYNDIDIDTVSGIIVSGNYNFVTWKGAAAPATQPTVIDRGGYNNVGKR